MDSLTQIVLGAACGEVVLGKKVGNRAMLLGALGGTIPDLDVIGNIMLSDMEALAFHRGISHSIFFAVTTPFLFGWITDKIYKSGLYQNKNYKIGMFVLATLLVTLIGLIINLLFRILGGDWNYIAMGITTIIGIWALRKFALNYIPVKLETITATRKDWTWLFFWSIFTHPLLDAFTAYGTQLFAPFSNYRVAFNTISVADPIYTVPFLLCLIGASFLYRNKPMRRYLNYLGLLLSSAYLIFTVFNKRRIDKIFEKSFQAEGIDFQRYRTSPSIFNNILWQGVAETKDGFYYGMYSLLDKEQKVYKLYNVPKNHDLIAAFKEEEDVKIAQWFSDGYYTVMPMNGDTLQIGDLRYGTTKDRVAQPEDFVFKFTLSPNPDGSVNVTEGRDIDGREEMFGELWDRVKGK